MAVVDALSAAASKAPIGFMKAFGVAALLLGGAPFAAITGNDGSDLAGAPRLLVHEREARVSVFARLPAGIRLMVGTRPGPSSFQAIPAERSFACWPIRMATGARTACPCC